MINLNLGMTGSGVSCIDASTGIKQCRVSYTKNIVQNKSATAVFQSHVTIQLNCYCIVINDHWLCLHKVDDCAISVNVDYRFVICSAPVGGLHCDKFNRVGLMCDCNRVRHLC